MFLRKSLLFFICMTLLTAPAGSLAGPFGTAMGDAPEKYGNLKRSRHNLYDAERIPMPHSGLDRYQLGFGKTGLDRVVAFTDYEQDPEGVKATPLYQDLRKALTEKYGKPSATEGNMAGSRWTKGMAVWDKELPADLGKIILSIRSDNGRDSIVTIIYIYKNLPTPEQAYKDDLEVL